MAFHNRLRASVRLREMLLASTLLTVTVVPAAAQDATLLASLGSGIYNTGANWNTGSVPTGTAFFGASNTTSLSFSSSTTIGGWTFNSGAAAYTFSNSYPYTLNFTGAGIVVNGGSATISNTIQGNLNFFNTSTAGSATISTSGTLNFFNTSTAGSAAITNHSTLNFGDFSTAGNAAITNSSVLTFSNTSTAGNAAITNNNGVLTFNNSSTAGNATVINGRTLYFENTSTAGNATITNNGSRLIFYDASTAGSAIITNNNTLNFQNASTAGNATISNYGLLAFSNASFTGSAANNSTAGHAAITNNASGTVDFSGSTGPAGDHRLTAGSIAGAGIYNLGANELTVGSNNLSTEVSGVISGTDGSLVKIGSGTLTLSGANTYSGGTLVDAGTLLLSGAGTLGASGSTTVKSGGTLDLGGTTQTQSAVNLAGGTIQNGGLNAPLTSTGGTINGLGGSASLTTASGTTTLFGTNAYAGATTVNGGVLYVEGSITGTSSVSVNAGGTLTGTGTIDPLTVTFGSGSTFAPGNGTPGTSTGIVGNLALASGAMYIVMLNPSSASFATVTGTAALGGASVNTVFASGSYVSKQYTILTAIGGVSGTFGALNNTNLPSNFHTTLSYDATHAYLDLTLNFTPPPPPSAPSFGGGLSGNQQAVGKALINFFNSNGSIPLVFGTLTPAGLTQASGESATGSQQTTFQAMGQFMGLLTDPFVERGNGVNGSSPATGYADESASADAASRKPTDALAMFTKAPLASVYQPRWSVWASGYGGSQSTSGNAALGSNDTTSRIAGTAVGADYLFSPNTLAGFALAGGGTNFSVNGLGSGRSDLFQAGAYLRHTDGAAYISAALAYGWQDITTNRTVTIAGLDQLRAEFNANAYSGRVEGGYRFVAPLIGGIGLTPYAAGQFTTFDLPAYAEQVVSGATNFALAYGSTSVTDTRSELGLRTDKSFAMSNGILTLRGRLAWAHDFNLDRSVAATFQALPGASFVVNGAAQASDSALTTASAEMKWTNGWSAAATFEGEFSNVTRSYAGKGVARYAW